MRWLQVQPGEVDDYTTASNIWLRISNKEYCSTTLRILINSLEPRKPWCKFKSSAAPLAIKSDNYAVLLCRNDHIETDCAKNKMAPVTCVVGRYVIPIYAMVFLDLGLGD